MKRIPLFIAGAAMILASCQQSLEILESQGAENLVSTFTASTEIPGTRTALGENGAAFDVLWQPGDKIVVMDCLLKPGIYVTGSTGTTGTFEFESGEKVGYPDYVAYYPASLYHDGVLSLPAVQKYAEGNIAEAPMYAVSSTSELAFKNLCGIIRLNLSTAAEGAKVRKITLKSDKGLRGRFKVVDNAAVVLDTDGITLDCGEDGVAIGAEAVPFHIAVPAGNYSTLEVAVWTTDGKKQARTTKAGLKVVRSNVTDVTLRFDNFAAAAVTDLSFLGSANCYLVPMAGSYKFKATVKGNGAADLAGIEKDTDPASIAKAELVWATFNTVTAPEEGQLIKDVRYEDGYVWFSTDDEYLEGNALVAVKDASDNILWSWHLWFESDDMLDMAQKYPGSGRVMMDRNLGALSNCYAADNALDFGFAYQNGRKDPFMMTASRTEFKALGVLGTYTSYAGSSTVASSILRPTVVFGTDGWGGSANNWSSEDKTIFDPCPPGWMVPPSDIWKTSGFNSASFVKMNDDWNTYHGCIFNGMAWFPATGDRWGANHNNTGKAIRVWAQGAGKDLASDNGGGPSTNGGSNPGHGYSVRCVRAEIKDVRDGLVQYWPFDGNAKNAVSGGIDATVNGATLTEDRFGVAKCAYYFDGGVSMEAAGAADFGQSSFTANLWVSTTQSTWNGANILRTDGGFANGWLLRFVGSGKLEIWEGRSVNVGYTTPAAYNDGNWHMLTFVRDVENRVGRLYVDAEYVGGYGMSPDVINDVSNPLRFGTYGGGEFYAGKMDDVRLYDRALSSQEIFDLYILNTE